MFRVLLVVLAIAAVILLVVLVARAVRRGELTSVARRQTIAAEHFAGAPPRAPSKARPRRRNGWRTTHGF